MKLFRSRRILAAGLAAATLALVGPGRAVGLPALTGTVISLTGTAASPTQIDLYWTGLTGTKSYEIWRWLSGSGKRLATTSVTSFSDTGLTPSTTHKYVVIAFDRYHKEIDRSNPLTVTTPAQTQNVVDASYRPLVGPAGVSCPAGAVAVAAGASIQAAIDANPAGTTFCLGTGTHSLTKAAHVWSYLVPKDNDQFIGQDGGQVVVKGPGATLPLIDGLMTEATGIVIKGLIVEGFGKIDSANAIRTNSNWLLERNEFRYNDHGAVSVTKGSGVQILNNYIHHNRFGLLAFQTQDLLVQENEVAYNSYHAQKFVGSKGVTMRGNYYHDDAGSGIWFDTDNDDVLIENNLVMREVGRSIENEIGCDFTVRGNWVQDGGGPALQIGASGGVQEIYNNTFKYNYVSVALMDKGTVGTGSNCTWKLSDVRVHDNTTYMARPHTGLTQPSWATTDNTIFKNGAVKFNTNTYYLTGSKNYFVWEGSTLRTDAQWKAYGHDIDGTFKRI